ncbi:hypothetical protein VNO78_19442 [Psophocarpus tetragonolobus]|uniref:Uncharacterized protein n=1 Tax=Psophocarpus tetragonolobus TaxID=3891 RepID=A0AAN9XG80_PSOTE
MVVLRIWFDSFRPVHQSLFHRYFRLEALTVSQSIKIFNKSRRHAETGEGCFEPKFHYLYTVWLYVSFVHNIYKFMQW